MPDFDSVITERTGFTPTIIVTNIKEIPEIPPQETEKTAEVTGQSCPQCGNGIVGQGFPGERQVNDPNQDTAPGVFPHITQSETTIAAFGSYIIFGFNDSNKIDQGNISGIAFSSDSGVTWCDCGNLPKGNYRALTGDPVTAVDTKGIFYYASLAQDPSNVSVISVSTGQVDPNTKVLQMGNPITVGVGESNPDPNAFQDKEWIAVGPDRDPDRVGQEALYITWTDFNPPQGQPPNQTQENTIRFSKFTTGLNPTVLIPSTTIVPRVAPNFAGLQGSFPVVDRLGNLYVFYLEVQLNLQFPSDEAIKMLKSTDGGKTFSSPITVASPVTRAFNAVFPDAHFAIDVEAGRRVIRTNEFPHAYAAPDGTLYVVWNDGRNIATTGIDIYLTYSTDGGITWAPPVQITNTKTHEFFPSVAFNCGKAHIQYSRFDDPQNVGGVGNKTFALFEKSFSIAEGLSTETMVSTVFSPVPITRPNFDRDATVALAPGYMGDYNQIIAGPPNVLYHAWGDNRYPLQGENNPDIFFIQTNCEPERGRGINFKEIRIFNE